MRSKVPNYSFLKKLTFKISENIHFVYNILLGNICKCRKYIKQIDNSTSCCDVNTMKPPLGQEIDCCQDTEDPCESRLSYTRLSSSLLVVTTSLA